MKNNKGFSLIELLFAMSIIMMLVAIALPIHQLLDTEQHILKNRHMIQMALHDELLEQLWRDEETSDVTLNVGFHHITISYEEEGEYIEGCARWTNEKDQKEVLCLSGIKEK